MKKGKSLFDSDELDESEGNNEKNYDDNEENSTSNLTNDKIFGNSFNSGETDFEVFGKLKIQDSFNTFDTEFTDNSYETYERGELQKEIYDMFIESEFYEKYKRIKQVPKSDMKKIYYYFAEPVRNRNRYTMVEIFTEIANFMNLNYKEMFHNLLPLDKQLLIEELDCSFGVLKKKKIKRLF